MNINTLTYQRQANPAKDTIASGPITKDDMIYVHHFGTGFQELVMHSNGHAVKFAQENNCEVKLRSKI